MTYKHWIIAVVVFVVLEILPPVTHFGFLCLAFGAVAASIVAVFSTNAWLPWVVFVVISGILMPFLIPLAKFLFMSNPDGSKNAGFKDDRAE